MNDQNLKKLERTWLLRPHKIRPHWKNLRTLFCRSSPKKQMYHLLTMFHWLIHWTLQRRSQLKFQLPWRKPRSPQQILKATESHISLVHGEVRFYSSLFRDLLRSQRCTNILLLPIWVCSWWLFRRQERTVFWTTGWRTSKKNWRSSFTSLCAWVFSKFINWCIVSKWLPWLWTVTISWIKLNLTFSSRVTLHLMLLRLKNPMIGSLIILGRTYKDSMA